MDAASPGRARPNLAVRFRINVSLDASLGRRVIARLLLLLLLFLSAGTSSV
jgi:hypothetical protein